MENKENKLIQKYQNMSKLELLKSYKKLKFVEKFDDVVSILAPVVVIASIVGLVSSSKDQDKSGILASCFTYISAMPFIIYRTLKDDSNTLKKYEIVKNLLKEKYQINFPATEALKNLVKCKYNLKVSKEALKDYDNEPESPKNHNDFQPLKFNILSRIDINRQNLILAKQAYKNAKKEEKEIINNEIIKSEQE